MPVASKVGTHVRNGGDQKRAQSAGSRSSAQNFGIDEASLETRRQFIRLGEEERSRLAGLISWARSTAPKIAKEFYAWQFEFGPTRRFFEAYATGAGTPVSQLRQALERAQTGYFVQIFEGAEEDWGLGYFERRLKVGTIHDKINLPFKINDISNSITSAVEEQTATTNEIGRSVNEAAQGVNDIAKNIGGVATAARNTTQGANDTKATSLQLGEMAARLQASVSKFTF